MASFKHIVLAGFHDIVLALAAAFSDIVLALAAFNNIALALAGFADIVLALVASKHIVLVLAGFDALEMLVERDVIRLFVQPYCVYRQDSSAARTMPVELEFQSFMTFSSVRAIRRDVIAAHVCCICSPALSGV